MEKQAEGEGLSGREDRESEQEKDFLANPVVPSPAALQVFALFQPRNWGIRDVFLWQVQDEQALFT